VRVTLAFGRTAPEESVTTPVISPEIILWANAALVANTSASRS